MRNRLSRPPSARHTLYRRRFHCSHVIASGPVDAPPVILLHGSGSNSAVWIRDVVEWAQQYRVYAVDVIGEPGLSAPSRPPLRPDTYADWLGDVCQQLGVISASFVGTVAS